MTEVSVATPSRRNQNFTTGIYCEKFKGTQLRILSCRPFKSEYHSSHDITSDTHTEAATKELRTILGLLNHAAILTRPDIMFQTALLATRIMNATTNDIAQAKHIVSYLHRTKLLGLIFTNGIISIYRRLT